MLSEAHRQTHLHSYPQLSLSCLAEGTEEVGSQKRDSKQPVYSEGYMGVVLERYPRGTGSLKKVMADKGLNP